ncbi:hypothetical protein CEXT_594771 [Caerostris extrusa]|uniref:Uncharacterized protein n=1 Tax=Caerostris extrusa TaxID=172846 RepID=A0AAV4NFL2_CAEEX|nr:hypothetical protein CEXT_594771 [Caerostris extrusa]
MESFQRRDKKKRKEKSSLKKQIRSLLLDEVCKSLAPMRDHLTSPSCLLNAITLDRLNSYQRFLCVCVGERECVFPWRVLLQKSEITE